MDNRDLGAAFSDGALRILEALRRSGSQAYIVGGAVRDVLSGDAPHDEDIATDGDAERITAALRPLGGRQIDRGGGRFGTVVLLLDGAEYEITTFRSDGTYSDGRHPDAVTFSRDVEEDLRRRDFTMNAIAWSPLTGLRDPFGGIRDIRARLIRAVGDPEERLREDPLRMLRGVRFAIERDCEVEERTLEAIQRCAPLLGGVSRERIGQEFLKMFSAGTLHRTALLHESGLLAVISPALDRMFSCGQNTPYHRMDVGRHTCAVLERCTGTDVRFAALLHDAGKPEVRTVGPTGFDRFWGHGERSAAIAEEFMREYRFSRARTDYVAALTAAHDELQAFWETKHPRRMVRDFLMHHQTEPERFFTDLMELKRADLAAQDPAHPTWEARARALDELERILREWIVEGLPRRVADLAVDGRDLMAAGFTGPRIAEEKTRLLRLVMDDPGLNTREALLRRLSGRTAASEE